MEIKTDEYSVTYDSDIIVCKGSLLLNSSAEYAPILNLFNSVAEKQIQPLTLDVRNLEFLNSSGINTFTKFIVNVRKKQVLQLIAIGYGEIPWQVRFLKNLQRLMPSLVLKLE
ncbi:hypothetical protein QUF74_16120 [Candidatus Halobeggiatoa sp. HSG11]|nr:hypothetical protein [Candidatus Halobeggiatoa sp. HSG11]